MPYNHANDNDDNESKTNDENIPKLKEIDVSSDYSKTFQFHEEGHTLGNSLRMVISKDDDVELCGYTIPHPMEPIMNMRIQTSKSKTSNQALRDGLKGLVKMCDDTEMEFKKALKKYAQDTSKNVHHEKSKGMSR